MNKIKDWAQVSEAEIWNFIRNGGDVNLRDRDGATALMAASMDGSLSLVTELLKQNANPNLSDSEGVTALMVAARGFAMSVQFRENWRRVGMMLLGHDADANAQKRDGWSVLMFWAQAGDAEMVKFLLAKGANVNAKTKQGVTALVAAAATGQTETVKVLLGQDSAPIDNTQKMFAMHIAEQEGHSDVFCLIRDYNS